MKYINSQGHAQRNNNMCEPSQNQMQQDDKVVLKPAPASSSTMDKIYGKTLPQGSFRLLCVQAAMEVSEPIHVELETYRHSHRPDYETVSYTWGSEQGDSSPCRPIFIGPYWDVLLQTENCWQMLRYARPTRGIRLLWVDAICINQDNAEERAIQVAMMAQIYSDCERTLVYLGPEVVKWHPEDLPARKGLHELAGAGQSGNRSQIEDHRELLESRKYFTRLWIIQEVILSPKLIIPIDNVTYWADRTTDARLQKTSGEAWNWWDHTVPWIKSIGQQEFPVQNACEALLLTTQNQSSDPRDRLFGLLALLGSDDTTGPPLRANYTLSNQHIWIGFFAHAISKDGALWVLHNASGHKAVGSVPSWAPDWSSHSMWSGFRRHVLSETDWKGLGQWLKKYNGDVFYISSEHKEVTSHDWQQEISVDAASGALVGVRAMRLFTFVEKPKSCGISPSGHYIIFSVEDSLKFRLVSSERLDEIVQPLKDHLYLLRTGSELIFLVLREHEPTTLKAWSGYWNLLSHAPTLGARRCCLIASCISLPVSSRGMWSSGGDWNLQDYISQLRKVLSSGLEIEAVAFPLLRDRWGLLPLYWVMEGGCLPYPQCSDSNLLESYLACLPARYHKCAEQSYVTLTVTDGSDATIQEMNEGLTSAFEMWFGYEGIQLEEYIEWEWSVDNTRWTKFADWDFEVTHTLSGTTTASGTWKSNPIPHFQISGTSAGAILDHGTAIRKADGTVRLRAPTDSILKYLTSSYRGQFAAANRIEVRNQLELMEDVGKPNKSSFQISCHLHRLAKGMGLTSLDEIRNVLFDTSRDWSHLKFQATGLSRGAYARFLSDMQLVDIF